MRKLIGISGAALLMLAFHGPATAADKGMTIMQLKAMLSDLGYDAESDGKQYVEITGQGKTKSNVYFELTDDSGSTLDMYSPFDDIPDAKLAALPAMDLLKGYKPPFFYSIGESATTSKPRVVLKGFFDTASLTKQALRRDIDLLVATVDEGEQLGTPDNWTVPPAGKAAVPAPKP